MKKFVYEMLIEEEKIVSTTLDVNKEFVEELRRDENFSRHIGGLTLEELITRHVKSALRLR